MAPRRYELQTLLESLTPKVYFNPGSNLTLSYPCIIYKRDYARAEFADNGPYSITKRYSITVIDRNPDSDIPDKVSLLPMCSFNRHFVSDNLNHDVYTLYF